VCRYLYVLNHQTHRTEGRKEGRKETEEVYITVTNIEEMYTVMEWTHFIYVFFATYIIKTPCPCMEVTSLLL
jgi:hypothetical protein